jgi:4-hydroxy-tetrahydrodipicolinate synthase
MAGQRPCLGDGYMSLRSEDAQRESTMATRIEESSRAPEAGGASRERIAGVWCPVLTPLDHDLKPDALRLVAHARWLLDDGCHGLVVFGTTGEANSFAVDERIELLEALLDAGLPRDRLLVGTGCCALTDTVRLTGHALSLGITGVLALPPFYYKNLSDEALFNSFDQVIQRVGDSSFRLYLYHFPSLSGVPITPTLLERLAAAYPDILAGVKDSSGDWNNTKLLIERFPELAIFPGSETLLLPALRAGGAGCISASCNVNARPSRQLYDAFEAKESDVEDRQEELNAVRKVLQLRPMIPVMKHLIADQRSDPAWRRVRPPFLPLPDVEARALQMELSALGWRMART